jgi:small GTP-binding protein
LLTYAKNEFPNKYEPTIFDNYTLDLSVGEKSKRFNLFDTAGQEDFEQLRKFSYPNTDVFIVCYSIDSMNSFENVETIWIPEILKFCQNAPFILVATKSDLREDQKKLEEMQRRNEVIVEHKDGLRLAKKTRAANYVECSALKKHNIKEVFDAAIAAAVEHDKSSKSHLLLKTKSNLISSTKTTSKSNQNQSKKQKSKCSIL